MTKAPTLVVLLYLTLSMAFADDTMPLAEMTLVGDLSELSHGVSGTVYIKDDSTLVIKKFTYDGTVRNKITVSLSSPKQQYLYLRVQLHSSMWESPVSQMNQACMFLTQRVTMIPYCLISLVRRSWSSCQMAWRPQNWSKICELRFFPPTKPFDVCWRWLSVWCRQFKVDFGSVMFGDTMPLAEMTLVGDLSELSHGVSGTVYIKDESTLVIKKFTYDGTVRNNITVNLSSPKQQYLYLRVQLHSSMWESPVCQVNQACMSLTQRVTMIPYCLISLVRRSWLSCQMAWRPQNSSKICE